MLAHDMMTHHASSPPIHVMAHGGMAPGGPHAFGMGTSGMMQQSMMMQAGVPQMMHPAVPLPHMMQHGMNPMMQNGGVLVGSASGPATFPSPPDLRFAFSSAMGAMGPYINTHSHG